jgi:competence protein ComEA
MADNLPPLGVAAPGGPPAAPAAPPPPVWTPAAQWTLAAVAALTLVLLAWRGYGLTRWSTRPPAVEKGVVPLSAMDLNRASETELESIPGLGPARAGLIVKERQRGAFRSVDDLRRVKGIGPATLERVRPFLYVGSYTPPAPAPPLLSVASPLTAAPAGSTKKPPPAGKIDLNRASETELRSLPGIGPKLSARIVEARQKQPFRTIDELRRVKGIGAKTLEKLRPYITTGPATP